MEYLRPFILVDIMLGGSDAAPVWLADSDKLKNVLRKETSIVKVSDQPPVMTRWKDTLAIRRDPTVTEEMGETEVGEDDKDEGWTILPTCSKI